MRFTIFLISIAAFLFTACSRPSSETNASGNTVPLHFYIVQEQKFEGGEFIDTADFPKLGYVASTPDLVITQLQSVVQSRQHTRPALEIRMFPNDAKSFSKVTERAVGKHLLITLGGKPLTAPVIWAPISTPNHLLMAAENEDNKETEHELKKLVR
jgi:preprotein translocase subunit SecD